MATKAMPNTLEEWQQRLEQMTDDELRETSEAITQLEYQLSNDGPQNDDELHEWIKYELGIDIPRVAVCEDHDAPFDFVADVFFERENAVLVMGARSSGKTFLVAVLHWVNSRFKPGCESCTFGAQDAQSFRAYNHLKNWMKDDDGEMKPEVVSSMMKETLFRNGSKVEVLGSTPSAVNGPHPNKVHADEIELMRDDTWKESRNMSRAGKTRDGKLIIPQDILTSTRKGPSGRMQELIDEIEESIEQGFEPPRRLYAFCIKEASAERPNCRMVSKEEREARLIELDMDPSDLCNCNKIRRGDWSEEDEKLDPRKKNGAARTLDLVCDGGFFRSRGHEAPSEVDKHFRENDKETFEVQQLCSKAEMKFHYVPQWSEAHHVIREFEPDPANGPIFQSVDWGGTNPHAVNWYQVLNYEVEVFSSVKLPDGTYPKKRIPQGAIICFDEIYKAEIGNAALGNMVKAIEAKWRKKFPEFRVKERFADPQGKAARLDWRAEGLKTQWHTTREFEEHIKKVKNQFDDDLMFVDARCEWFRKEIKAWRRDEKTLEQIDEFNHCMSNFRYAIMNIHAILRSRRTGNAKPGARKYQRKTPGVKIVRTGGTPGGPVSSRTSQNWRAGLGSPINRTNS